MKEAACGSLEDPTKLNTCNKLQGRSFFAEKKAPAENPERMLRSPPSLGDNRLYHKLAVAKARAICEC